MLEKEHVFYGVIGLWNLKLLRNGVGPTAIASSHRYDLAVVGRSDSWDHAVARHEPRADDRPSNAPAVGCGCARCRQARAPSLGDKPRRRRASWGEAMVRPIVLTVTTDPSGMYSRR